LAPPKVPIPANSIERLTRRKSTMHESAVLRHLLSKISFEDTLIHDIFLKKASPAGCKSFSTESAKPGRREDVERTDARLSAEGGSPAVPCMIDFC
jgi:hypothetical protein